MKFIGFLYRNVLYVQERYGMESRFQQKALDWEVQGHHGPGTNETVGFVIRVRAILSGGVSLSG